MVKNSSTKGAMLTSPLITLEIRNRDSEQGACLQQSIRVGAWDSDHTEKGFVDLSGVGKWRRCCLKQ